MPHLDTRVMMPHLDKRPGLCPWVMPWVHGTDRSTSSCGERAPVGPDPILLMGTMSGWWVRQGPALPGLWGKPVKGGGVDGRGWGWVGAGWSIRSWCRGAPRHTRNAELSGTGPPLIQFRVGAQRQHGGPASPDWVVFLRRSCRRAVRCTTRFCTQVLPCACPPFIYLNPRVLFFMPHPACAPSLRSEGWISIPRAPTPGPGGTSRSLLYKWVASSSCGAS